MQLQGLSAGNRTRVLWITRPVLYHRATEAVADNLGANSVYIYIMYMYIYRTRTQAHGNGFCSSAGIERWSRDPGSRVQFSAGGLGVVIFATCPSWVLKWISFWHSNLPYIKKTYTQIHIVGMNCIIWRFRAFTCEASCTMLIVKLNPFMGFDIFTVYVVLWTLKCSRWRRV